MKPNVTIRLKYKDKKIDKKLIGVDNEEEYCDHF